MRNPTYADKFQAEPMPERLAAISRLGTTSLGPVLSVGIKTITHNRDGMRLHPHKIIAIEMMDGDELASFDLTPSLARQYASRLVEFADAIETKKAS